VFSQPGHVPTGFGDMGPIAPDEVLVGDVATFMDEGELLDPRGGLAVGPISVVVPSDVLLERDGAQSIRKDGAHAIAAEDPVQRRPDRHVRGQAVHLDEVLVVVDLVDDPPGHCSLTVEGRGRRDTDRHADDKLGHGTGFAHGSSTTLIAPAARSLATEKASAAASNEKRWVMRAWAIPGRVAMMATATSKSLDGPEREYMTAGT